MSYFDNAATTYPKPDAVYSFMDSFYRNHGGSVGRGGYALATTAKGLVDETRKLIQEQSTSSLHGHRMRIEYITNSLHSTRCGRIMSRASR